MKKSNKRPRKTKRKGAASAAPAPAKVDRRSVLSRFGTIALFGVAVAAVGFWGVRAVQASVAERDLTRVGTGTPAIVQVHDINCSTCIVLQQQTRTAMDALGDDAPTYLIADLNSDNGLAFAAQYGAGQTTLLLFDDDGNLTRRVVGVTPPDQLEMMFRTLIAQR